MLKQILFKQIISNPVDITIHYNFNTCNVYDINGNNIFFIDISKYIDEVDLSLNENDFYKTGNLCENNNNECNVSLVNDNIFRVNINGITATDVLCGCCSVFFKINELPKNKLQITDRVILLEIVVNRYNTVDLNPLQKVLIEKILHKWIKDRNKKINVRVFVK